LSGKPSDGYDTGTLAADLVALMDALGHQRFGMAGHDTGLWIGYALAADHPDWLARLAVDRLGYPTRIKDISNADATASLHAADSRTVPQAFLGDISNALFYPSAAQVLRTTFSCQSFLPDSTGNPNLSEFCHPELDGQIQRALAAESTNAPDTAALWGRPTGRQPTRRPPSR
jgi:pimeloyl-ACP methyl ester carboxylesterase